MGNCRDRLRTNSVANQTHNFHRDFPGYAQCGNSQNGVACTYPVYHTDSKCRDFKETLSFTIAETSLLASRNQNPLARDLFCNFKNNFTDASMSTPAIQPDLTFRNTYVVSATVFRDRVETVVISVDLGIYR